jgi:tetratricopeptide (TPR) repeat protein
VKTLAALLLFAVAALAAPDPALKKKLAADLAAAEEAVKKGPPSVALYSRRGDANFFAGKFPEALADYQKMVELDPTQEATHWRLGISYYLNGEFDKGAKLFEEYHKHDDVDRENGIWHYLCRAGIDGVGSAQLQMLRYSKPDRPPMELIYDLLAGIIKTDEFFRTCKNAD